MTLYEHIFITRQDITQTQAEELTQTVTNIIQENDGTVTKTEYWGLQNLAYKIKKNRKGHYILLNIDAPHTTISEMERKISLNEDIIRHLTIRVDEHDEEPSPPLQSKARHEQKT